MYKFIGKIILTGLLISGIGGLWNGNVQSAKALNTIKPQICFDIPNYGSVCDPKKARQIVIEEIKNAKMELVIMKSEVKTTKINIQKTKSLIDTKTKELAGNNLKKEELIKEKEKLLNEGKLKEAFLVQKMIEAIDVRNAQLNQEIKELNVKLSQLQTELKSEMSKMKELQKQLDELYKLLLLLNQIFMKNK